MRDPPRRRDHQTPAQHPPPPDPTESVELLTSLLRSDPTPTELGIAILRAPSPSSSSSSSDENVGGDGDVGGDEDGGGGVGYPSDSFVKMEARLGVHAPDLPRLAREFKCHHRSLRRPFLDVIGCNVTGAVAELTGHADDEDNELLEEWCRVMFDATSCLLVLCPDDSTAWADRRRSLLRMIETKTTGRKVIATMGEGEIGGDDGRGEANVEAESEAEAALRSELRFLDMLFTQHSKKPSAWAYRKWVWSRLVRTPEDCFGDDKEEQPQWQSLSLLAWAEDEIRSMTTVAESYPKNYYAWTHRLRVVRTVVGAVSGDDSCGSRYVELVVAVRRLLEKEVSCTGPWLRRHVSDHSAAHFGSEVLRLLLRFGMSEMVTVGGADSSITWGLDVVSEELRKARELLEAFPSHETLWLHRRYCAAIYAEVLASAGTDVGGAASDEMVDAAIERFARIEVRDVSGDEYLADHLRRVEAPARAKSYPLAYVTWLRYHVMIRLKLHGHDRHRHRDLARVVDEVGMLGEEKLRRSSDDDHYSVPHNMWRSHEGPMPC